MCGRYIIAVNDESIEMKAIIKEINEKYDNNLPKYKMGEIFPSDVVPVVTKGIHTKKEVNIFKWGFWGHNNNLIINARLETLTQKPTFRNLLNSKRCLIPANGFFEWKKDGSTKIKYLIKPQEYSFFYMAGLFNQFLNSKGEEYTGFVIITTQADSQMKEIHERMPIILDKSEGQLWLEGMEIDESLYSREKRLNLIGV